MRSRAIPRRTRARAKQIDDHTIDLNVKKGGKVITTGHLVISADGKSRTVTTSGMNAKGKKYMSTAVYDKK